MAVDHPDINLLGEPTAVLLRRDAFDRFGLFNERLVQYVDAEYWTRVGTAAGLAHVPEDLAHFRVHAASMTRHNTTERVDRVRLDLLVVRHEYAFGRAYEPLRAAARRRRPGLDLEREFWEAAYGTLVLDGVAASLKRADGRVREEAEQVYAAYPRLRRFPRGYVLRRAVAGYLTRHQGAARAYRLAKRVAMPAARLLGARRRAPRPVR